MKLQERPSLQVREQVEASAVAPTQVDARVASHSRLSESVQQSLRCPACASSLHRREATFGCANDICGASFPIVDGIPVLINERRSIFKLADFTQRRETYFAQSGPPRLIERVTGPLRRCLPTLGVNLAAKRNYARFTELLHGRAETPRVLVLGGSIIGDGMEEFIADGAIEFVESDISFGPRTMLIGDAHDIPFAEGTFDAVVAQAVLEHVVDPYRCAAEIHRVLKPDGLVYAETPFMQQVHGGRYDFTRFTHLGHRRLFRHFEEIDSGALGGPGAALAWSNLYFLLSFARDARIRALLRLVARLVFFPLKYADPYLLKKSGTLDAAWGYYFLGRRSCRALPDRELIALYRGAI